MLTFGYAEEDGRKKTNAAAIAYHTGTQCPLTLIIFLSTTRVSSLESSYTLANVWENYA